MKKKKILLEEEDFRALIAGKIIKKEGFELMLSDIGYNYMLQIISNQMKKP